MPIYAKGGIIRPGRLVTVRSECNAYVEMSAKLGCYCDIARQLLDAPAAGSSGRSSQTKAIGNIIGLVGLLHFSSCINDDLERTVRGEAARWNGCRDVDRIAG